MKDGSVTPTSLVHSLGLGQINCRRQWGRDGSVHDGFMGLVSCLDQLDLQVVCVQETQSHPMSLSSRGQPFRCDGPVGSHWREAVFFYPTLPLWRPLSLGPLTHSPIVGVSSRALFVSFHFYAPHALALPLTHASSSGARLQPQSIVSRSSHTGIPLLLAGDSSGSVVHDRPMHLFCPLCRRSCSLIPWYFGTLLISLLTVVVPFWTSFSQHLLFLAASLSTACLMMSGFTPY